MALQGKVIRCLVVLKLGYWHALTLVVKPSDAADPKHSEVQYLVGRKTASQHGMVMAAEEASVEYRGAIKPHRTPQPCIREHPSARMQGNLAQMSA